MQFYYHMNDGYSCIVSFGTGIMRDACVLFTLATVACFLTIATGHSAKCPITNTTCYCHEDNDTCYFELTVEHKLTMMYKKKLVYPLNGKLYYYDDERRRNKEVDRKYIYTYCLHTIICILCV